MEFKSAYELVGSVCFERLIKGASRMRVQIVANQQNLFRGGGSTDQVGEATMAGTEAVVAPVKARLDTPIRELVAGEAFGKWLEGVLEEA